MTQKSLGAHASPARLVRRVLDAPDLADAVRALPPRALARVVEQVGLEDASELVALATTDQLVEVFDTDLWRSDRAGEDERFDAGRFLLWLGVLREAGDDAVAARLVDLPEDLVTLAFHREILVVPEDTLAEELERDDGRAEKALESCLSEDVNGFEVVSRHHEGWDDVLAALLAVDARDHDACERLLSRCAAMDAEAIDDSGLFEVLSRAETLEEDVAADREQRRSRDGYVAPSSAAAFLKLARGGEAAERDPLTKAYFRDLGPPAPVAARATTPTLARLLALAADEGAPAPRPALGPGHAREDDALLADALRELRERAPVAFAARSEELAYLANVLAAGASRRGRKLRPVDAVRASMATVSLGLHLAAGSDPDRAAAVLADEGADLLFRRGWAALDASVRAPARAAARPLEEPERATLRALGDDLPHLVGDGDRRAPRFFASPRDLAWATAFLSALPTDAAPERRRR